MVESAAHVEHVFAADELFFSTTDSHGRIRRANSTFMRLSGYPRGALVGRAHNVVRHADMPAGLFRSIWDAIEEGRAASAYITNRSSDDGHYRVFATIVPSGSGYLSVRTLPMLTDLRDDIEAAYARVRDVEEASAAAGSTRREVAAAGQAALQAELQALGYADAIDFTRRVLVAEVGELLAHGVGIPDSPQTEGPVARILGAMGRIEAETAGLVGILQEGQRLADLLGERAGEIEALSTRLGTLREAMRAVGTDVEVLGHGEQADDVAARCQQVDALVLECSEQLHPLSSQIEALRGDLDSVSFRIALARLHNLAAGLFALQILQGQDEVDANDAVGSLTELCSALSDGADALTERRRRRAGRLRGHRPHPGRPGLRRGPGPGRPGRASARPRGPLRGRGHQQRPGRRARRPGRARLAAGSVPHQLHEHLGVLGVREHVEQARAHYSCARSAASVRGLQEE